MWGKKEGNVRGKVRLHTGIARMIQNFKYFIVFTSTPGVLLEQNDWYRIQPWKVNEIKAYKKEQNWCEISKVSKCKIKYRIMFDIQKYIAIPTTGQSV